VTISDDILMAFADGELDEATRQMVETAERDDPDVRRRLAAHRQLRARLQTAFAATLDEPVPERLLAAARKPASPIAPPGPVARSAHVADVVRLADRRAAKSGAAARRISISAWPALGSLAASILVGLGLGYAVWHAPDELLKISSDGSMVAGGTLAKALSTQLAAERPPDRAATIGLSFLAKSGAYCRTFSLSSGGAGAGLACRDGERWRIRLVPPAANEGSAGSGYRTAGSNDSPQLRSLIESEIQGEPLTQDGEEAARRAGWRAGRVQ
jgi:anti-sigma factor RsiW